MVGWIILSALAALIVLILLIPVRVCVHYGAQLALTLRVAFVPIPLIPPPPKANRPKPTPSSPAKAKKTKKSADSEQKKKPNLIQTLKQEQGLSGLIDFFRRLASLALRFAGSVAKRIKIERLDLRVRISAGDSADTAMLYGKACAALYPSVAALLQVVKHRALHMELVPDFMSEQNHIQCILVLRLRVFWVIHYALRALGRFIQLLVRTKKASAAGAHSERKRCSCPKNPQKI